MIFWQLFYTFLKIGIFTFGGGYAMVALIQNEVVVENQWLTSQEFTDILAISQASPGPLGINTATYTGYTAVVNAGYPEYMGILGAFLASFSVILLPFLLMLIITKVLLKHKNNSTSNCCCAMLPAPDTWRNGKRHAQRHPIANFATWHFHGTSGRTRYRQHKGALFAISRLQNQGCRVHFRRSYSQKCDDYSNKIERYRRTKAKNTRTT